MDLHKEELCVYLFGLIIWTWLPVGGDFADFTRTGSRILWWQRVAHSWMCYVWDFLSLKQHWIHTQLRIMQDSWFGFMSFFIDSMKRKRHKVTGSEIDAWKPFCRLPKRHVNSVSLTFLAPSDGSCGCFLLFDDSCECFLTSISVGRVETHCSWGRLAYSPSILFGSTPRQAT